MKRARLGVVAAIVSALALAAVPAQAGPGDPVGCFQSSGEPTQNVVSVDGLDVTVRPGELPADADSAASYAETVVLDTGNYAWCVQGDTYNVALCWQYKILMTEHVELDPATGEVTIHGNDMVADATAPCPPL